MVNTQSNTKGMFIMITTFNANWEDESVDYDALLNSAARSGTVSHTIPLLHPWDGRVSLVSNAKDTLTIIPGWSSGTVPPKSSDTRVSYRIFRKRGGSPPSPSPLYESLDTKDTLPSRDCTPWQSILGYQRHPTIPG